MPRRIIVPEMLSEGTFSVISNIFHDWEPCLIKRPHHCDAKDVHDLSESRVRSLVGSAIEQVVAEYDALADRLGRSFANGDSE